jgi:hypothetical protein
MTDTENVPPADWEEDSPKDDPYELARAKEAVRQGEMRLTAQQSNLAAMEARATAIFGWSVPTVLGLGAAALTSRYTGAASAAAVCLFGAAVHCMVALWPRHWGHQGYSPLVVLDLSLSSEVDMLESIAQGNAATSEANAARLSRFGWWLKSSWLLFLAAPVMGGIGLIVGQIKLGSR